MIVAMDGPAGCGKSTIARLLSERMGFLYINSGNIYRALTYAALQKGIGLGDEPALLAVASRASIDYDQDGSILLDGVRRIAELRSAEVEAIVAQVSAIPEIRTIVNEIVRRLAQGKDIVVEGRDMTTVVFPRAELKFFIDASTEERARRRFTQASSSMSYEEILENIKMRDAIDRNKKIGALKIAPDALYLDTSGLTIEAVYEKVYSKILHLREAHGE
ncbi:MAG: (d)CMP kinase [Spirochaetia bacterium]|jgi:cytidylate kinase|nr:(d)CMP kinase [Spirochaetia bacterium]